MGARIVAVGVLAAGPLLGLAAPAQATTPAVRAPGTATLFSQPDFTGTTQRITYSRCVPGSVRTIHDVGSFDNQPLTGCQVQIGGTPAGWFSLCAGRGVVPPAYRRSSLLRIQPGLSQPCPPGTASTPV